jgi:hypothetical protein
VEAARLPLLPSYEALMSLPSMRALLAVDDIEASYRPDPVLLDEAAAIRRDFALAVQDVKMATFRKIIASIERAEKERAAEQPANDPPSDLPFSLPGLSSPAPPTSAVPKPANGSDYTNRHPPSSLQPPKLQQRRLASPQLPLRRCTRSQDPTSLYRAGNVLRADWDLSRRFGDDQAREEAGQRLR